MLKLSYAHPELRNLRITKNAQFSLARRPRVFPGSTLLSAQPSIYAGSTFRLVAKTTRIHAMVYVLPPFKRRAGGYERWTF